MTEEPVREFAGRERPMSAVRCVQFSSGCDATLPTVG